MAVSWVRPALLAMRASGLAQTGSTVRQSSEAVRETLLFLCQYDAQVKEIEDRFRDFGDIKSFFDLIGTRGMIFVNFVSSSQWSFNQCKPVRSQAPNDCLACMIL